MEAHPTDSARLAARDYPKKNVMPVMEQQWRNLLFLHWEYDPQAIQQTLPEGLFVDTFDGKAYVTISPFWVPKINLKSLPTIPGISHFLEINLRTYVFDRAGIPGIWFYSLDANHYLANQAAKAFYYLPYQYAQIHSFLNNEQQIEFSCLREGAQAILNYRYQGLGPYQPAESGTLDFFLIERYILFVSREQKGLGMGRVHHTPYPICKPQVWQWDDRLFELDGLTRPQRPPDLMHFSPGVNVDIFSLQDHSKH
jgi:uncharacterized protein YqjF (DUF2071 family)